MGYESVRADEAAECLALAYRLADDAEQARHGQAVRREITTYREAAALVMSNRRLLNRPSLSGLLEASWWHAFRHKWITWSLILLWIDALMLGWTKPRAAFQAAIRINRAAETHLDHDWDDVERLLGIHWRLCLVAAISPLVGGV